jgi:hypothetical protein
MGVLCPAEMWVLLAACHQHAVMDAETAVHAEAVAHELEAAAEHFEDPAEHKELRHAADA